MLKNRYPKKELQEFRTIILNKLKKAEKEYDILKKAIKASKINSSETGGIKVDDSTDIEERETLNELATRQSKFIYNLKKALERIEKGTYGICRQTGRLIHKERLKIVPHATLSVEAKQNRG